MYNLLVVDDELIIARYVAQLFKNLESLDNWLLDVKSATSAFEALDILQKEHVDIVLADVNMPAMSGIALLEQIKDRWPHVKVILMSGYDEFKYVQAAIRNKGVDYVLKSEGEEQLIISVKKAIEELEQELRSENIVKKAAESLKMANAILREKAIIDILEGEKYDPGSLERYFSEIDMPLKASEPVFMIIGKVGVPNTNIVTSSQLYRIKAFVEEHLKKAMKCISVVYKRRILWLLQAESERSILMERVINQLDGIQRICYEMLNAHISFCTDREPVLWEKLDSKFEHLNFNLGLISARNTGVILVGGQLPDHDLCGEDGNVEEARSAIKRLGTLISCFSDVSREKFFEVFDSLMQAFKKLPPQYNGLRYEAVFVLAAHFISIINRMQDGGKRSFMLNDMILKIMNFNDWSEVEMHFRNIADKIFTERDEDDSANISKIVDFISRYASEHMDEELSLDRFAKLLHYHPSYLSRVFKSVTGVTFSDYIAEIKIAKAKEMLNDTSMKIIDIAYALGFENASYFTRFFKKRTGLSPQEYKNKVLNL